MRPITTRKRSLTRMVRFDVDVEKSLAAKDQQPLRSRRQQASELIRRLCIVFVGLAVFITLTKLTPFPARLRPSPATPPDMTYVSPYEKTSAARLHIENMANTLYRKVEPLATKVVSKSRKQKAVSALSTPHARLQVPLFQEEMYHLTARDWPSYEAKLSTFIADSFSGRIKSWLLRSITSRRWSPEPDLIPASIWQTGKSIPDYRGSFQDKNTDASFNFYDDKIMEAWFAKHFANSSVATAWHSMERAVLKADLWRYLVLLIEGGFYSDQDTDCLKPIRDWGTTDVAVWDLGDKVSEKVMRSPPQVVVGIEVDVPDITGWETFWPRPIQIVQWTMASVPGHPIFIDAMRRVVESMHQISDWDERKKKQAMDVLNSLIGHDSTLTNRQKLLEAPAELLDELKEILLVDPFDKEKGGLTSLIEATGPGAFSDAVFSYLQARYGLHWSQLHNIQTATRIGEVAILPITGFAPFYRSDWQRWEGIKKGPMAFVGDITHSQAMVNHQFKGSWRKVTDDVL